jgi:hypothetical protein
VLQSVKVTKPSAAERCDLCNGRAKLKITNGQFFILITCSTCWAELNRLVDSASLVTG